MICKCGNDTWHTVRVARNKRLKAQEATLKVNDNYDSRYIICRVCGKRFITETYIVSEIINKGFKVFIKNNEGEFDFTEHQNDFPH